MMQRLILFLLIVLFAYRASNWLHSIRDTMGGQFDASSLRIDGPRFPSIASSYPGDAGIEKDPAVVFVETFNRQSVTDFTKDWSDVGNVLGMTLVMDPAPNSADMKALELKALGGLTSGAHLYKTLVRNYEELYIRYYVKYAADGIYHHTGVNMGGFDPPTSYHQGLCCHWPEGNYAFSVALEFIAPFAFDFYNYWVEMRRWGEIVTPRAMEVDPLTKTVKTKASGNAFLKGVRPTIIPNKWYSVEFRVKMNTPTASRTGRLSLWIDGIPVADYREGYPPGIWEGTEFRPDESATLAFEGFRWRTSPELGLNWIWILHYVTKDTPGHASKVWYDNVVVAKKYIGPIYP